ncbi:MAG: hypothetical protein Q7R95_10690 [bacterium]|nr:hypothetical protein [bacterium]
MNLNTKQYNVGDKVFFANYSWKEQILLCPACYGKKQLKVILGNGEEVIVPCNGCEEQCVPTGHIKESEWTPDVKEIIICRISAKESLENGKEIESYYFNENYYVDPKDNKIFDTKQEAEERVKELIDDHELEKKHSIKRKKENGTKTYGWHIRYHSVKIKELKRDLEYHKKKLIICKENDKSIKNKI